MITFKDRCSNILTFGAAGALLGKTIGGLAGSMGGPVTAKLGATLGGAAGSIVGVFFE